MLSALRNTHPDTPNSMRPTRRALSTRPSRGFSMIELLVTLVILALIVVTGLPSMSAGLRNAQIRNAGESLLNGLNRARIEAVKRNAPVMFSLVSTNASNALDSSCALSSTSASWVVSVESPAGKCDVAASETTSPMTIDKWARGDGASNVTLSMMASDCTTAASTTSVTFDGYGRLATGTTPIRCIVLNHSSASTDNRPLRVVISGSNVRMCDPSTNLSATDPRKC